MPNVFRGVPEGDLRALFLREWKVMRNWMIGISTLALLAGGCGDQADQSRGPRRHKQPPSRPVSTVTVHLAFEDAGAGRRPMEDPDRGTVYVNERIELAALDYESAQVGEDQRGRYVVDITLVAGAGERFAELTRQNMGGMLAMVDRGELLSCATIRSEVGRIIRLTGNFSRERAEAIVAAINGG